MKLYLSRIFNLLVFMSFLTQADQAVDTQHEVNQSSESDDITRSVFKEIPSLLTSRVRVNDQLTCLGQVLINPQPSNLPSLSVAGPTIFNGNLDVSGTLSTKELSVDTITSSGSISLGSTTIDGTLTVSGNTSLGGNTSLAGDLSATQGSFTGSLSVGGSVYAGSSVTINGDLNATGAINGLSLGITNDASISGTTQLNDVNATGAVTISGDLLSQNLALSPTAPPPATDDGILFVSDGTAPAANTGDLYYRLPLSQGGGVVDLLASGSSGGGVVSLSAGNGILLTPDPITITGEIATNGTSANIINTLVQRDGSGNFTAGTITANLTGAASQNVLKAGDSMSGVLTMLNQQSVRFEDASGFGNYAGLRAPSAMGTSYTLALPATGPLAGQFLQANSLNPLNLEWITAGGAAQPAQSKTIYVTKFGNDATGDGSFAKPYGSLSKALDLANSIASATNPITISIAPGIYLENNTASPLSITAAGISILGESTASTTLAPASLSNNFIQTTVPTLISNLTLASSSATSSSAIRSAGTNALVNFRLVNIQNFATGISLAGSGGLGVISQCGFIGNATAVRVDNVPAIITSCLIQGSLTGLSSANTACVLTGANATTTISTCVISRCNNGIVADDNTISTATNVVFRFNNNDVVQSSGSSGVYESCLFEYNQNSSDIDLSVSGTGTKVQLVGCFFQGNNILGVPTGSAIKVFGNAQLDINGGTIQSYQTALIAGDPSDTSATQLSASGLNIALCSNDLVQQGTSTVNLSSCSLADNKVTINDGSFVTGAFFNRNDNNTLHIGSFENQDTTLIEVATTTGNVDVPSLVYRPSIYSTQSIAYLNPLASSWTTQSDQDAATNTITTDRTESASIRLVSDTGSPVGATGALRGWDITKLGSSANLSFDYQNSDTIGQSSIPQYTLMQLDGVNNQLQLPTAGTQLLFGGDTNLYRSGANTLKTDDTLAIGTLSASRAVATNANQELVSSATTATELGYLSGTTSSVQTQLDGKVAKTGDSMSGNLNMLNQTGVRFQDGSGLGKYAGINAPTTVNSSYTVSLPATGPLAGQVMQADPINPTHLNWVTQSGSITPATSRTVYVATFGDDISGDGSFDKPFASLAKGLDTANALSSASNPLTISIGSGVYVEDNSAGALEITAEGITIEGASINSVVITPGTLANNLLTATVGVFIADVAFNGLGSPATAISLGGPSISTLSNVTITNFGVGISCTGTPLSEYGFDSCLFINNGVSIDCNDVSALANNCVFQGASTLAGPPANTAIQATGANSIFVVNGGSCLLCQNGFVIGSNTKTFTATGVPFKLNVNDIAASGGSKTSIISCSFEFNVGNFITIQASGSGTQLELIGCTMDGRDSAGVATGTALKVSDRASVRISSTRMRSFTTAIQAGEPTDSNDTELLISGLVVRDCTNDIVQQGSATLNGSSSTLSTAKITINDSTHVGLSYADPSDENALFIGSKSNTSNILIKALIGNDVDNPELSYEPSLYGTRAIGHTNNTTAASFFTVSPDDSYLTGITTDRASKAGLRLFSDTGSPVGATGALRGWDITKIGSSANLGFDYQNSDIVGQPIISPFTLMQLDGVNNQLQLPTLGTQIVFAGDTNLYRSGANTLKTDDTLAIGTLTASRAVATNANQELISSATTTTELGYLAGTTSSVQTQLNNKVSKTGDTMSGPLTMLNQTPVRFQDGSGLGNYVGINAPVGVGSSYTVSLPATGPLAGQVLKAGAPSATDLTWQTQGGGVAPASSQTVYVTKFGNDATGDGSFDSPFASLAKAIDVANTISSTITPVTIMVSSGIYTEDNSAGPLTITAPGITITGDSYESTIVQPISLTNDFILITASALLENIAISASSLSSGTGISFANALSSGTVRAGWIRNFATGVSCSGSGSSYVIDQCSFTDNSVGVVIDATSAIIFSTIIYGSTSGTPDNTGIICTGTNCRLSFSSNVIRYCDTGLEGSNNASLMISDVTFAFNHSDIVQTSGSQGVFNACIFEFNPDSGDIDVQISGTGTSAEFIASFFRGKNSLGVPTGTAIKVSSAGRLELNSAEVRDYQEGAIVGDPADTAATQLAITNAKFTDCTTDIIQQGSSTLTIEGASLEANKILINDSSNVQAMFFDASTGGSLHIGSFADTDTQLMHVATATGPSSFDEMMLMYRSSLYGAPALGFEKDAATPVSSYTLSNQQALNATITTDRTSSSALRLMSDEGSPLGATGALRGWDIIKEGTSGSLSFDYQNSDLVGQIAIPQYSLMKLDGVANQLQFPTGSTQLVFAGDTNLYRSAANTLKTDDSLVVGTLTADRAVATDGSQALVSSVTTATELGYLSGTTSSVQTQLNNKVNLSGSTMTGTLTLPAGSAATPSLQFSGSTNTGISAGTVNTLSFDTNGTERMRISSAGTVSINGFTTAGVVHNNASGDLTSSLIVNADVDPAAAIVDTKLATISTAGKVANTATTATSANTANAIVARDALGNFSANSITANLVGNVTGAASQNVLKSGDTMTGALTLPSGSDADPSLKFAGSTNTGLSAAIPNTLAFDTNGQQRMNIDGSGTVAINGFTSSGVVHNNASGALSSSLIINSDITDGTIANAKLATASSANNPNHLVVRDGSGDFAARKITLSGSVTNATDAATKEYVDTVASAGLSPRDPALALADSNITLNGTQTIDSVPLSANDRVLLVAQSDPVENGLWLVQAGAWTRPADFANGSTAGGAYVLILDGSTYAGSSWLCSTPTAIVGTDPVQFDEFSLPNQVNGANVGIGQGQVFKDKTGVTLNFKTILGATGTHITVTNNTNEVALSTDATSSNTADTLVARDGSGNFSAGTITANLTGSASNNVLKSGDSMSGPLELLTQNEIRFDDLLGGQYVALRAPSVLNGSYSLSLPATGPLAGQVLSAGNVTATDLEWLTLSASNLPSTTRAIYVSKVGNDSTGDGSELRPYASLAKALDTANGISSVLNPVAIIIAPGIYVENNTVAPLSISARGISIIGESSDATVIVPASLSNNLLQVTASTLITNIGFNASGVSSAAAITTNVATGGTTLRFVSFQNFQSGVIFGGSNERNIANQCGFIGNQTAISISNVPAIIISCIVQGTTLSTPANTGISLSGSNARVSINSCTLSACDTACIVASNATATCANLGFRNNSYDIIQSGGSQAIYESCLFTINSNSTNIDVQVSGTGTQAQFVGCSFNGKNVAGVPTGSALKVSGDGAITINGGLIEYYQTALIAGDITDTSSTELSASGVTIIDCDNDLVQQGSATVNLSACVLAENKITISDPLYVTTSFFDLADNNTLTIGSFNDSDTTLLSVASATGSSQPSLVYRSSLYSAPSIGYLATTAAQWFTAAQGEAQTATLTTDRTRSSALRLMSDEGSPLGATGALRGWDIIKEGTSGSLSFDYQNSDLVGQIAIPQYSLMKLDGVANQLQLPTASTQLVFAGDTNLYRSAANTLKTDDSLVVGTLTADRAVATDGSQALVSSVTTATELGYLSGTTSSVQTQLNNKVNLSGSTMTGTLTLPAGSAATPSLQFSGSTNTGISAGTVNTLSFDTNGTERMRISSAGTVSINGFTTAGVVHNNASGDLTSSLIVNADVDPAAAIVDTKLATISTAGKVANSATTATSANTANAIVARDASGNFSAGTLSVSGMDYRAATSGTFGLRVPATVTSYTLTWPSAVAGSNGQVLSSDTSGNLSWITVPTTATAITNGGNTFGTAISVGTNDAFSTSLRTNGSDRLSITSAGAINLLGNTTLGAGRTLTFTGATSGTVTTTVPSTVTSYTLTYPSATASTASSLIGDVNGNLSWLGYTNNNTPSTLVQRDGSGNFSAGTITANLVGNVTGAASLNVLKAGDTMTGALILPAGSAATPSLRFTGSTNTGISAGTVNTLSLATNGTERMRISPAGVVAINGFTTAGVVHNDASGNLTSSLVVNADIDPAAAIADTKLATITTSGKVANSATTATSTNTANTIVLRDSSGNFSAGTITAAITGAASLNVLKAGDTMTGSLTLPAGTSANPSLNFTGSLTTGLSASTANTLSLSAGGSESLQITATDISCISRVLLQNLLCNQSIQTAAPVNNATINVNASTSILALTHNGNRTGVTIVFPPTPTNGQLFTITLATTNSITYTNNGNGASVVNAITGLNPGSNFTQTANGTTVTYIYLSANNTWYRIGRG